MDIYILPGRSIVGAEVGALVVVAVGNGVGLGVGDLVGVAVGSENIQIHELSLSNIYTNIHQDIFFCCLLKLGRQCS